MDEKMALGLVKVLKQPQDAEFNEAFDRAYELTKVYAGSANAPASAVPALFEIMVGDQTADAEIRNSAGHAIERIGISKTLLGPLQQATRSEFASVRSWADRLLKESANEAPDISHRAHQFILIFCSQTFGSIFQNRKVICLGNIHDLIHLSGIAVQMYDN